MVKTALAWCVAAYVAWLFVPLLLRTDPVVALVVGLALVFVFNPRPAV